MFEQTFALDRLVLFKFSVRPVVSREPSLLIMILSIRFSLFFLLAAQLLRSSYRSIASLRRVTDAFVAARR